MKSGKANMAVVMAVVMTVVLTVAADGPTGDALAHAAVPLPVPIAPFVPHCWYCCRYWCRCCAGAIVGSEAASGQAPSHRVTKLSQVAGAAAGIPRPGLHDAEWTTLTALCTSPREARFPDVSIGFGEAQRRGYGPPGSEGRPALNLSNGQFRVQRWAILEQPRPPRLPQTLPQSTPGHGRHPPSVASLIACHGLFWKVAWRVVTDAPSGCYGRVLNIPRLRLLQCSGQPFSLKVAQGEKIRLSVTLTPLGLALQISNSWETTFRC